MRPTTRVLRRGARHRLACAHRSFAHAGLRLHRQTSRPSRTRASARCASRMRICDQLRDVTGRRPDISPERPAVRVHAHANGPKITVSIDLSGEGLHRRGYRTQAGEAPLRENLAAGILLRAGWPEKCRNAADFLDPMCGSGTLVIEAAMIAAGIRAGRAPALLRILRLGGARPHRLGGRQARRAGTRAPARIRVARPGRGCHGAAGGARKCRARRRRRSSSASNRRGSAMRVRAARRRVFSPPIRRMACASKIATRARALMKELGGVLRAQLRRLGRGDSRRLSRCGPRARHPRRACAHRVERRARMPPAATARLGRIRKDSCCTPAAPRASTNRWRNRPARRCSATASPRTSSSSSPGPSASR